MAEFKMTPEQEAVLAGFTCERLSACGDKKVVDEFYRFHCTKGGGLLNTMVRGAWKSDLEGTTNYYIIRDPKGKLVMFFSLRYGVLFEGEMNKTEMLRRVVLGAAGKDANYVNYVNQIGDSQGQETRIYPQSISGGITKISGEVPYIPGRKLDRATREDPNKKVIWVSETHPAIELVEYGVDDDAKEAWAAGPLGSRKLGETMFWRYIVPIMLEAAELVGCEYAYLFAADWDGGLVNYYKTKLHFRLYENLGAVKPTYDVGCRFMYRRLETVTGDCDLEDEDRIGLNDLKLEFFDLFNKPRPKTPK